MHPGQPLELPLGLMEDFLGRARRLEPLPELGELGVLGLAFAQLFLDGLDLLPQEVVALGLGELRADLLLDLGRELEHGELTRKVLAEPLQPDADVDLAQENLPLLDRERQARRQQIGQPARLAGVHRRDLKLLGNLLALIHHPLEEAVDVVDQGVELDAFLELFLQGLDLADQVGLGLDHLHQARPGLPLADDPGRSVRELEHLQDRPDADRRVQVGHARLVHLRMQLADQAHQPLADQHVIDQANPARPVDDQRHDRLRKHDVGAQRKKRQPVGMIGTGIPRLLDRQRVTGTLRRATPTAVPAGWSRPFLGSSRRMVLSCVGAWMNFCDPWPGAPGAS